jgi:hypothetical protein
MGYKWKEIAKDRLPQDAAAKAEHASRVRGVQMEVEKRMAKISELGVRRGDEVIVKTKEGPQRGTVDSIDEESARIWVRGLDKHRDHPNKPVLCSPFAILEVVGSKGKEGLES